MGSTLLTGWSLTPESHSNVDFTNSFDSTLFANKLPKNNPDFTLLDQYILESFETIATDEIVGYSLGSLLAIRIAQLREFKKVTLLAPAFSFIKRTETPFGIPQKVLQSMQKSLWEDHETTMSQFYKNSGFTSPLPISYAKQELISGLKLLEHLQIPKVEFKGTPEISIRIAKDDRIISQKSSLIVSDFLGVVPTIIAGGHASLILR